MLRLDWAIDLHVAGDVVMNFRVSRLGLFLASAFSIYAGRNLYMSAQGEWQAPILNAILTLPFSVLANFFCDWLQQVGSLTHQTRNAVESCLIFSMGILEFYLIGWILENLLTRNLPAP
ncbi:MAG TPA: hypothetical protein PK135_13635 [Arenimonas sp.]|nr:hypothetical protein [Arenimonas sp.]